MPCDIHRNLIDPDVFQTILTDRWHFRCSSFCIRIFTLIRRISLYSWFQNFCKLDPVLQTYTASTQHLIIYNKKQTVRINLNSNCVGLRDLLVMVFCIHNMKSRIKKALGYFRIVKAWMTASVVWWPEFLATDTEVSGSIPCATRFSE